MNCLADRLLFILTAPAFADSSSTCFPCVVSKAKGTPMACIILSSSAVNSASNDKPPSDLLPLPPPASALPFAYSSPLMLRPRLLPPSSGLSLLLLSPDLS
eukprot:GHUV01002413.1.p5 GENE.GHUV01002413.1~~GHUV01002413.1.p5  ORF type:complete len:101 (+),score=5.05 GHUV01002413.1:531-833(+)